VKSDRFVHEAFGRCDGLSRGHATGQVRRPGATIVFGFLDYYQVFGHCLSKYAEKHILGQIPAQIARNRDPTGFGWMLELAMTNIEDFGLFAELWENGRPALNAIE
jgi:hypothetical protein